LEGFVADEGFFSQLKQLLVGKPIASELAHHERGANTAYADFPRLDAVAGVRAIYVNIEAAV
jgi:hypothetical protein